MIVQEAYDYTGCLDDTVYHSPAVYVPTRPLTREEAEEFLENIKSLFDFSVVMFGRE